MLGNRVSCDSWSVKPHLLCCWWKQFTLCHSTLTVQSIFCHLPHETFQTPSFILPVEDNCRHCNVIIHIKLHIHHNFKASENVFSQWVSYTEWCVLFSWFEVGKIRFLWSSYFTLVVWSLSNPIRPQFSWSRSAAPDWNYKQRIRQMFNHRDLRTAASAQTTQALSQLVKSCEILWSSYRQLICNLRLDFQNKACMINVMKLLHIG